MGRSPKILLIEARFYDDIADQLVAGAGAVLEDAGVSYDRLPVPGVFEVPAAMRFVIRSMEIGSDSARYAGFVALGCVIRGETDHYEHICREASRALMDLSITFSVALGFGILTCETYEQALVRASVTGKNKGADAARACLRMVDIKKSFRLLVPQ